MSRTRPVVALAHDYLTQRGGAERVALNMLQAFPEATLWTSLWEPASTYREFSDYDVRTLPLNRSALLRARHRLAMPLLAPAFSRLRVDADVLIASTSGWAHGARCSGRTVVYCHSPAKWLYARERYFSAGWPAARLAVGALAPALRLADRRAVARADRFLVNSTMVRDWVRDVYDLESEVVPPPHGVDTRGPSRAVPGLEPGYVLCVARLLPYKNVAAVVAAAELDDQMRVVVVGSGPLGPALRARSGPRVQFLERVDDEELRWLYQNCLGLVSASLEDFGLAPLEAAAFGRPAAVLRWGGHLDTVVEGRTGTFFDAPEARAVAEAVAGLRSVHWDEDAIRAHADRFSPERFRDRLQEIAAEEAALV